MKKIIYLVVLPLLVILIFTHNGQSKTKSYYSGDAISYNNNVYITSTNSGSLELLKLENNTLRLISKTKLYNGRFNRYDDYSDAKLVSENNQLFVYATNGFGLYKYEVVNDNSLVLVASQQNTYWEWYNRVDKFGDNIVTISAKGIKVWNQDLQVINGYNLTDIDTPYNLRGFNQNLILDVQNNHLNVYDRSSQTNLSSIALNYKDLSGNRQSYIDADNNLYVVDDYYAKKFNLDGKLLASFQHIDQTGYDVSASGETNYIYFSNGAGVVKLNKETMGEAGYTWTGGIAGPRGWAMGLKVVSADGDKVVVFNNSNILVLNSNLKMIASYTATEDEESSAVENLFLNLNHNSGTAGASIELNGGGYVPNEKLDITFAGQKSLGQADNHGRFDQFLIVPTLSTSTMLTSTNNGGVDIKVNGENSKLSYSISFKIAQ